jgi:hypothetical protein
VLADRVTCRGDALRVGPAGWLSLTGYGLGAAAGGMILGRLFDGLADLIGGLINFFLADFSRLATCFGLAVRPPQGGL